MPTFSYFDTPSLYKSEFDFYNTGSAPLFLEKLCEHLKENEGRITEIFLGLYLFNNAILNDLLTELAAKGIKVHVITIPINGYDKASPKEIIDIKTRRLLQKETKYGLAKDIFSKHYKKNLPGYSLYIFPHVYLRSAKIKKFSRGELPYSLHIKSFLIKYRDGSADTGISSSNFAVRDLVKEESMAIVSNECAHAAEAFFKDLIKNAILLDEYDFQSDYLDRPMIMSEPLPAGNTGFLAPFYFNSAFKAEDAIKQLIDAAKESICIVAQHICPVGYTFNGAFHSGYPDGEVSREGFLHNILIRAAAGVKVSFISQTFASGDEQMDTAFRTPSNKASFIKFYNGIKGAANISYAVNENIHSKYIIIDDKVFISSFNYTPTQFIYLDRVKIEGFEYDKTLKYEGICCETGHYCIIDDEETSSAFKKNFAELMGRKETVVVKE